MIASKNHPILNMRQQTIANQQNYNCYNFNVGCYKKFPRFLQYKFLKLEIYIPAYISLASDMAFS